MDEKQIWLVLGLSLIHIFAASVSQGYYCGLGL